MRGGPLLLVLACACAAPAPSRPPAGPGDLVLGTARLTLPPGVSRWTKPGAQTAFGGTLVAIDSQVFVELAVLPPTALPLRPYLDSVVAARNARLDPDWQLAPAESTRVGERPAWQLQPACGDCEATELYLEVGGTPLVAAWSVDGLTGHPREHDNAAVLALVAAIRP